MIATDEDALICDLAETYHIYDYKSLPLQKVAIFCIGLRDDSRIKMKISGIDYTMNTLLFAKMVDYLALLYWTKTKDAQRGINKPKSIANKLMEQPQEKDIMSFDSPEDFEAMRLRIIEEVI